MATTFQAMMGKIESHLECSICTHRFREPKLLDCHHTFCLKCLQELRASQVPRYTKILCPLCRRETTLTKKDVADLPNNFDMMALVEEFTKQEQLLKEKFKQEVANLVAKVERRKTGLQLAIKDTDESHKKLDAIFGGTCLKIFKKADKEVTRIREEEQKLKLEAEKIYEDRIKSFKTSKATTSKEVIHVECKLEEVNQLMTREDCYESSDLKQGIIDTLEELMGEWPDMVSDSLAFMDFTEGEETSLGKLVVQDELDSSELKNKNLPGHTSTRQKQLLQMQEQCTMMRDQTQDHEKLDEADKVDQNTLKKGNKMKLQYTYKKDQWSPLNPDGKRKYDRDFLLQFQSVCIKKPEGLPHIPDIILDRPFNIMNNQQQKTKKPNKKLQQALSSGSQQMTAGSQRSTINHRQFIPGQQFAKPLMQQPFMNQNYQKRTATQ